MNRISSVDVVREFTNNGITYGVYSVMFNNKQQIFIRNGDSIGAVSFYWGKPANQCVDEIREDVKKEFLLALSNFSLE